MDLNGIHFDLYKFLLVSNGVNKLFFFFYTNYTRMVHACL